MLKLTGYIIFIILLTVVHNYTATQAKYVVSTETTSQTNLSENNQSLLTDLQWFFEGLATGADLAENYLPVQSAEQQNRGVDMVSYPQLVGGIKYILTGIKDISKSAVKSLSQREARQSQLFPITSSLIKIMENWFRQLRLFFVRIVEIYKHYLPELMLGKCVGKYLIYLYPNRAFYEYPYLVVNDIFATIVYSKKQPVDTVEQNGADVSMDSMVEKEEHFVEQNEITDNDLYDYSATTATNLTSIKRRSTNVQSDVGRRTAEDILLDDVAKMNSWPKCLKLYTAETIFRNLEFYFFS